MGVDVWSVSVVGIAYLCLLFVIAALGDRHAARLRSSRWEPFVYALSLGIYCTSWTFYGSVGRAASTGMDFVLIYVGPALMLSAGLPLLRKVLRVAKANNVTSIADFIGARFGKSQSVAALVTVIAVIGVLPYLALQLQAVTLSFNALVGGYDPGVARSHPGAVFGDIALYAALAMAVFAILFGLRHAYANERHQGLMMAMAFESLVKLAAFLAVGLFATRILLADPSGQVPLVPVGRAGSGLIEFSPQANWLAITLVAAFAFVLLPRQFHVTVVESSESSHLKTAAWLFPLYLVLISVLVPAIAVVGLRQFPGATLPDAFVLMLPVANHHSLLSLAVFVGGLSASTSMVIVEAIALSTMICNEIVVPLLIRASGRPDGHGAATSRRILTIRRSAVFVILLGAYAYHAAIADRYPLASIGLISFTAVAQFAPAVILGMYWRGANRHGAIAGMAAGAAIWAYALLLPSLLVAGWLPATSGLGSASLPDFGGHLDPLGSGIFWSLSINTVLVVLVSQLTAASERDRRQAEAFVLGVRPGTEPNNGASLHGAAFDELKSLVERLVGHDRAARAFSGPIEAYRDKDLAAYVERLLSGVVGTASAHIMVAAAARRRGVSIGGTRALLDEASEAILFNHRLMRSTLENVPVLINYVDRDERYRFTNESYARAYGRTGTDSIGLTLQEVLGETRYRQLAPHVTAVLAGERQEFEVEFPQLGIEAARGTYIPHFDEHGRVVGFFTLYQDVTEQRRVERILRETNELLERRVAERTRELLTLNAQLAQAKSAAEAANLGKTRFLAAASHDLLQPLHVARLLTGALAERGLGGRSGVLLEQLETALFSVDDLLQTLLDISKLDAGALEPRVRPVQIGELLRGVVAAFEPMAAQRGLSIRTVATDAVVVTDPSLLRRIIQNFVSNALRYTSEGKVLVGCRRRSGALAIEVWDTGCGIAPEQLGVIFEEFRRLESADPNVPPGLGLGLAIVQRIADLLGHPVGVRSWPGRGSLFSVTAPRGELPERQVRPARVLFPASGVAGKCVLCIDDDPAVLTAMEALLEGWSCRVLTAASVASGLERLSESQAAPDLILMDYHLGCEATGFDAIGRLRQAAGCQAPAILVTANRTEAVRQAALSNGYPVLNKPLRPGALRALMTQMLAKAAN